MRELTKADVIDPQKNKERYLSQKKNFNGVSQANKDIILEYLTDMEIGRNVSGVKGERSYARLRSLFTRIKKLALLFQEYYNKNLIEVTDFEIISILKKMREGEITRKDGKNYKCVGDYAVGFKAFWHWYQKSRRQVGIKDIEDITLDLDTSNDVPTFVYFTFSEMKMMAAQSSYYYYVLMHFLFDAGLRPPKELMNVRAKHFEKMPDNKGYMLEIWEPASKTFGRKIKLMICGEIIEEYIKVNNLQPNDCLFTKTANCMNKYLKRIGEKVLGKTGITMYDFRHCSACYWTPIYKSESALKYRFGWKKSSRIYYYTNFLGMRDSISEDDMHTDTTKTQLEQQVDQQKLEINVLKESIVAMGENHNRTITMLVDLIKAVTMDKQAYIKNRPVFERIYKLVQTEETKKVEG